MKKKSWWPLEWRCYFDKYSIPYEIPNNGTTNGRILYSINELDTAWLSCIDFRDSRADRDATPLHDFFFESYLGGHEWRSRVNLLMLK